jgi:transposase
MSRKPKFELNVVETAKVQLSEAKTVAEMRAAQAVLLPALCGLSRDQTGACLGLSSSRVGQLQAQARNPDLKPKNTHGGRRRERMTIEEEKAFLEPWEHEAKTAGVIIVPPIHQALEKSLGGKIHVSQVYRMLERHGWRKVAPDSTHPKAKPEVLEAWKKNSRRWLPKRLNHRKRREKSRA